MNVICILKAVVVWVILMVLSTNIIGFVIRGLFWAPPVSESPASNGVNQLRAKAVERASVSITAMNFFWILISISYVGGLYHFGNILLASVAVLEMASRLPDLLWEIRNGKKFSKHDTPRGTIFYLATAVSWLCLPLTWVAICWWN